MKLQEQCHVAWSAEGKEEKPAKITSSTMEDIDRIRHVFQKHFLS